jgi:hypothetical protein
VTPLEDRAGLGPEELAGLQRTIDRQVTLADAIRWAQGVVADVIVQDEFTHDIVIPWGARWLVYDTT